MPLPRAKNNEEARAIEDKVNRDIEAALKFAKVGVRLVVIPKVELARKAVNSFADFLRAVMTDEKK